MGKNAHKKRHKNNTRRPKGAYQSTDDGDDKPSSRKSKRNSKCGKKSKYDFDMGDTKIRKTLDADGLEIAEMDADGNCFFSIDFGPIIRRPRESSLLRAISSLRFYGEKRRGLPGISRF